MWLRIQHGYFSLVFTVYLFLAMSLFAQPYQESAVVRDALAVATGLQERRLFDLLDVYCDEQLRSESINRIEKASIVLAYIQGKVAEATSIAGDSRLKAFQRAIAIASEFAQAFPDHPRRLLIDVQAALSFLVHGNLIRQEMDAEIVTADQRTAALDYFRKATSRFRDIEKQIDAQLPIARNKTLEDGELTPEQLVNLKNNIRYRLATVNLAKAQLYGADDRLNRLDALNQVLSSLESVTTQSNPELPLWWEAQISRVTSFRLMDQPQRVDLLFRQLPNSEPTDQLKTGLLIEKILCSIQFQQTRNWPVLLDDAKAVDHPTPQLELAVLQLVMAQASRASGTEKQQWQTEATRLVSEIETRHGRYWSRRAEILLVGSVQPVDGKPVAASEFQILVRQGDAAFRRKNYDDAIKAFSKAVKFATDANDAVQAVAMTVKLSRCYEQQQRHAEAASTMFVTSEKFHAEESAAAVHLRGCWNLLQVATDRPSEVIEKLQSHIANWPDEESSNQARLWLGNIYQQSNDWRLATLSYTEVDIHSPKLVEANRFIGATAHRWMREQRTHGNDWKASAREFVAWMRNKIGIKDSQTIPQWSQAQVMLLLPMLDVGMPAGAVAPDLAISWLQSALQANLDAEIRYGLLIQMALANTLKIGAQQGGTFDTTGLQSAISQLPDNSVLLKKCLSRMKAICSAEQLDLVADQILLICEKAMRDSDTGDKEFWVIEKAVAEVAVSETGANISALQGLSEKYPRSLRIQLAYARGLARQPSNADAALAQWRRVAAQVKPGSDSWLEAKYNVVKLMLENGQRDEAEKLVRYLEVTNGEWKNSAWSPRVRNLLRN